MTFALILLGLAGSAAVPSAAGPISKAEAEHYVWGGINDGWHLVQRPDLSIIEERLAPGAAEIRHYHRAARQYFHVLDGVLTMERDGHVYRLTPGQGIEIAPGVPHQARSDGTRRWRYSSFQPPKAMATGWRRRLACPRTRSRNSKNGRPIAGPAAVQPRSGCAVMPLAPRPRRPRAGE